MPRIKTTRTVTIALYLLRVYLLAMLAIILTKFIIEAQRGGHHETAAPTTTGQNADPTTESRHDSVQSSPLGSRD